MLNTFPTQKPEKFLKMVESELPENSQTTEYSGSDIYWLLMNKTPPNPFPFQETLSEICSRNQLIKPTISTI